MFCPNCGAQVSEGVATCESCGTQLIPTLPSAPAYPIHAGPAAKTSGRAVASMVLGIASLLAGSGILFLSITDLGTLRLVPGLIAEISDDLAPPSMFLGLVVGLLVGGGMLFIPGILALVRGYTTYNQIRTSGGTIQGEGLALVGFITGSGGTMMGAFLLGLLVLIFGGLCGGGAFLVLLYGISVVIRAIRG